MRPPILLPLVFLLSSPAWALAPDALRTDAPTVYTVKKGDTLWDIAAKFLDSPWRWPELWDRNTYISNPDLIYPGDRLRLRIVDGEPRLTRQPAREIVRQAPRLPRRGVDRLTPKVREAPVERLEPISTVDRSVVLPYIGRYGLMNADIEPESIGGHLVAGAKERMMYASGDEIFARLGDKESLHSVWFVFRRPEPVTAYGSSEVLGYLLKHIGTWELEGRAGRDGLFTGTIGRASAPIEKGDRIYPGEIGAADTRFLPHSPPAMEGHLLRPIGEGTMLGQGQMVVLDLGARDGLEEGHVLMVREDSRWVRDPSRFGSSQVPGRTKGVLMVVHTGERLSFALIMENTLPIQGGDRVVSPGS